jgi:hypothetical protein
MHAEEVGYRAAEDFADDGYDYPSLVYTPHLQRK